jgi:imidazolonepropionase-like amidohydrolase
VRTILAALTIVCSVCACNAIAQTSSPVSVSYIRAGHLFDPASGRYIDNVTLVVANQRIQSVETGGFNPPAGAQVLDLLGEYVLPGLIDCHTHLGARADRY